MLKLVLYFACLSCLLPALASAYTGVTIVMTEQSQVNQTFVNQFKEEISQTKESALRVSVQTLRPRGRLVVAENSELVIALGEPAFEEAVKLSHTTPVLGTQISMPKFEELQKKSKRHADSISAILPNQPHIRPITLIKTMLPDVKQVGILVGQNSHLDGEQLSQFAKKNGLDVHLALVHFQADLVNILTNLLYETDVLLAIPDTDIFNRDTATLVMMTSYRNKKPVIGYSRSGVGAGALAAVFSDSKHLAKQAAEIATQSQTAGSSLPAPQVAKYYSVAVNKQVARLFKIKMTDERWLQSKIVEADGLSGQ